MKQGDLIYSFSPDGTLRLGFYARSNGDPIKVHELWRLGSPDASDRAWSERDWESPNDWQVFAESETLKELVKGTNSGSVWSVRDARDRAQRQRDEAQRMLDEVTRERDEAREERDEAREALKDLESRVGDLQAKEADSATRERDAALSRISSLEYQRSQYLDKQEKLELANSELTKKLQDVKTELSYWKSTANTWPFPPPVVPSRLKTNPDSPEERLDRLENSVDAVTEAVNEEPRDPAVGILASAISNLASIVGDPGADKQARKAQLNSIYHDANKVACERRKNG